MHQRLNQFLEDNECFYPYQFGFRLNISTNNALLFISENIQTMLDDNEFAAGVFVDMKRSIVNKCTLDWNNLQKILKQNFQMMKRSDLKTNIKNYFLKQYNDKKD